MAQPKILCVGTIPPPYHGQAIAFEAACCHMKGTKYVVNQNFEGKSAVVKSLLLIPTLFQIWAILLFKRVDVVYFTCSRTTAGSLKDFMLLTTLRFFRVKIINHLHGSGIKTFVNSLPIGYRSMLMRAYERIDISIVLIESMKNELYQFWPEMDVRVIENFYTSEIDLPCKKVSKKNFKLLFLSNIIYSKGIFDLLDAFSILSVQRDDVELEIAGAFMDDDFMSITEIEHKFKAQLKKMHAVNFHGVISGSKKVQLLCECDIFVLPTFYRMEGSPISIIEAMRTGNAIVTTDHNYLKEVVHPENGVIVEKNKPGDLASKIDKLLGDPVHLEKMQCRNKSYAQKYYSLQQHIEKLDSVIQDVIRS